MTTAEDAYVPGVCNINHAEISQRRRIGYIGTAIFVVLLGIFLFSSLSHLYRIILVVPAGMAISGYLQARNHFCVGYASAGKQNAEEASTTAQVITDDSDRHKDKHKARTMNLQTATVAIVLTLICVFIPHI